MNKNKLIYWISTVLLSTMLLMSSGMYIFNNEVMTQEYIRLGYPTYIIYPLAFLKISAVIVILSQKSGKLKEWAYAGLFFNFLLAFFAHYMVHDGEQIGALIAISLLAVSYVFDKRVFQTQEVKNNVV